MKILTIIILLFPTTLLGQQQGHSGEDETEGILIGSAIGDAAGGPVEFVYPPLRSQWTTNCEPITKEAKEELAALFQLRDYPKEAEPFAQWEAFGPAGTITDDTRFKMIFFSTLKNFPGELTQQHFARSVMGAILGAIHGKEVFPKAMRKTVNLRMMEQFGQDVSTWMNLLQNLKNN